MQTQKRVSGKIKSVLEWVDVIVASVLIVVIAFSFVFRIVRIDGSSMNDTLSNNERVIISKLFYTPKAGDIVVISRNEENNAADTTRSTEPIIKRIIATENQVVNIDKDSGKVYVDGVLLDEPYIKDYATNHYSTDTLYDVSFPITVDKDCVFVLGDNRRDSLDSRSSVIGQVNVKRILGRAIIRVFPLNKLGGI